MYVLVRVLAFLRPYKRWLMAAWLGLLASLSWATSRKPYLSHRLLAYHPPAVRATSAAAASPARAR